MSRWNQIQDLSESLDNVPGASCASIAFLHYLHIYSNTNNQSYYVLLVLLRKFWEKQAQRQGLGSCSAYTLLKF